MYIIKNRKNQRWPYLLLLILAGEAVFILPFVLKRIFRPTVLDVFQITNFELGTLNAVYGFVALLSYVLGGPLADKYPPRKLIAFALWSTAVGGLVMAEYPSLTILQILYGFWGITTILLFWAPMIKATRVWGGTNSQGKAFGLLDGGRGLVGALFGALGVYVFSLFIVGSIEDAFLADRKEAFKYVILISSGIVSLIGVLVWFFMKSPAEEEKKIVLSHISLSQITSVLKIPAVYLLMLIILCAYVGYKTTDIFSLYAREIMEFDEVKSAQIGSLLLFIRPIIGISIGFLADRSKTTLWLFNSFIISILGALLFAFGFIEPSTTGLFFMGIVVTATGVYAARALYFATMQEGKIPLALTGTAVGLMSIIGFTPDIFADLISGYLLDNSPGIRGHQQVFLMLALFSGIGMIASFLLYRSNRKN